MNQNDMTNQEIGDDDSEDTGESTLLSNVDQNNLHYQQEVHHLGKACCDK